MLKVEGLLVVENANPIDVVIRERHVKSILTTVVNIHERLLVPTIPEQFRFMIDFQHLLLGINIVLMEY